MQLGKYWRRLTRQAVNDLGPFPLPSARYEFWNGDLDLTSPVENSADRELRTFFASFEACPERERSRIRERITRERSRDLKWHALRSAAFAIRGRDLEWVRSGLTAVAAVDSRQHYMPFVTPPVAFLYHAGVFAGPAEADEMMLRAVSLADPVIAGLISKFLELSPRDRHAEYDAYQAEVLTEQGIGFVLQHGSKYNPTYDLKNVLLQVRRIVASDRYEPAVVSIGDTLSEVALRRYSTGRNPVMLFERGTQLDDALRGIRGGTAIVGRLRPGLHKAYEHQSVAGDLVECADRTAADFLQDRLLNNGLDQALICVTSGRLLCAMKAHVTSAGIDRYETQESMKRFEGPLLQAIQTAQSISPQAE